MVASDILADGDLILSLMSSVGHEYDALVVLISSQHLTMSLKDAQFLFLMHLQRIDQLNTTSQLNVSGASAHFVSNSGTNDRKGRRVRPNSNNNEEIECYKKFDQGFQGPAPPNQAYMAQHQHNPGRLMCCQQRGLGTISFLWMHTLGLHGVSL
ncbi:hypothetical protein ACOSP7_016570 [Xanthoceras sorbifolium]